MLQGQAEMAPLVASSSWPSFTQTMGLITFVAVGLLLVVDDTRISADGRWGIFLGTAFFSPLC